MTEKFSNFATSTLASTINSSVTSLTVASASSFPATGNFRILVGNEIMLVTARTGNVFTIVRGAESSPAASHTAGAIVSHILTAGGFTQAVSENQGAPGYLPSDVPSLGAFTSSDFTIINATGKTITDVPGQIKIRLPGAVGSNRDVLVLTRPLVTTAQFCFTMTSISTGSFSAPGIGIGL